MSNLDLLGFAWIKARAEGGGMKAEKRRFVHGITYFSRVGLSGINRD